jgi:hypothetical protein
VSEFFAVVAYGSPEMLLDKIQSSIEVSSRHDNHNEPMETIEEAKEDPTTPTTPTTTTPQTTPSQQTTPPHPPFVQWLNDFRFKGEVVDRYPIAAVSASGTQFPDGIPMFCMPSGLMVSHSPPAPSYFCFVTTASSGERLYGHCLTIHDPMPTDLVHALIETDDKSQSGHFSSLDLLLLRLRLLLFHHHHHHPKCNPWFDFFTACSQNIVCFQMFVFDHQISLFSPMP